jgi:hypothetical protein
LVGVALRGPRRWLVQVDQRRTFRMRRDLVNLRLVALPMREVVDSIQHHRPSNTTA